MAELEPRKFKKEKNPALAAFLSIFPGAGAFYNGNLFKGIAFVLVFVILIILTDNAHSADEAVFGLMIAGFYIFQIIDSYNEAGRINKTGLSQGEGSKEPKEDVSLFSAVLVLAIGIIFQLANLDVITYREITRFWPLILIVFGVKAVVGYFKKEEDKNGQQ
jgi:TM2 domain-containing membrane protein YozV